MQVLELKGNGYFTNYLIKILLQKKLPELTSTPLVVSNCCRLCEYTISVVTSTFPTTQSQIQTKSKKQCKAVIYFNKP